ncbi:btgC [Candida pseudojiufengensis]|uniref:btgC n=1 Tax=Candida pseudojiufengensis TaxID=497109 RepID=UPI0022249A58|nr:btgC [Candida pseudojiufengensis]KAI5965583.1 btgC [Candida pseudojiufengensis]
MKRKDDLLKKRSVTTPELQTSFLDNLKKNDVSNLVKVNQYKIGRSSSANVFMEYGGDFSNDPDPILVKSSARALSQTQNSTSKLNIDDKIGSQNVIRSPPLNNSAISTIGKSALSNNEVKETRSAPRETEQLIIEPFNRTINEDKKPQKPKLAANDEKVIAQKNISQKSTNHQKSTIESIDEKPIPNLKYSIKVLPKSKKSNQDKEIYGSYPNEIMEPIPPQPKISEDHGASSKPEISTDHNTGTSTIMEQTLPSNSGDSSDANLKFSEEVASRRDATVIYTKKNDENISSGSIKEKIDDFIPSLGAGLISSRNSMLGASSIIRNYRNSNVSEYSKDDPYVTPTSTPASDGISKKSLKFFIVALISLIILLIAGFVPAILQLSKGTHNSVNHYFQNKNNLPHLRELAEKYLKSNNKFDFGNHYNTIDGLNEDVKKDSEVVSLMSTVSNVMFHGIAYSPINALEPYCGFAKHDAMLDLAKLSTVTTRIRTYGMQCDQADLVLDAIDHMNLNMTLAMGVWIGSDDEVNKQQMNLMKKVVARLPEPSRLINSIFIGNEVLFREDKTENELIEYILDAKNYLKMMHIDDIAVGTSEIGSLISSNLLKNCDVVGANIHPFFGGVSVEGATKWTLDFLEYQIKPYNQGINTHIIITEVGWPKGGGSYKKANATTENLKSFISDFLCIMRNIPIEYYFFEAFDEPWKQIFWSPNQKWETEWGIFNSDRSNKFSLQNLGCI